MLKRQPNRFCDSRSNSIADDDTVDDGVDIVCFFTGQCGYVVEVEDIADRQFVFAVGEEQVLRGKELALELEKSGYAEYADAAA